MSAATRAQAGRALDVDAVRADFPTLSQEVHGKPLAYLDNAATALRPQPVLDALMHFYVELNSNVHRGVHKLSQDATTAYEGARERVQGFLNARSSAEVIFLRGCTEAVNLVAQTYGRSHVQAGDEVLISAMEHHSNIVPWQLLCKERGAHLRVIPMSEAGELDLEAYEGLLGPRTRILALSHVSNALGTVNPVREMIETAHRHGVPVLLDGAQAVPHLPVDVQELGCDWYALSGHKMFGPTGIGVLHGRRELLEEMPPWQGGGDMIKSVSFEETVFNDLPHKFEAGTPNIAGVIGLGAAIAYLQELGMERVAAREAELLEYGTRALSEIPELRLIGTAREKAGVLSFVLDGVHPHDIGTIVDREGVAIRAGHHCAQPVMDFFGVAATARASLAFYNTESEIDRLVGALRKVLEIFRLMSELFDLYQEMILDHSKRPRNKGCIDGPHREARGHNPLCGDRLTLHIVVQEGIVQELRFDGDGCAISTASASLMTEAVKGRSLEEVQKLFQSFHALVTGQGDEPPDPDELGKLAVFSGVSEFPVRVKCATLAWHTLQAALHDKAEPISTE